MRGLLSDNILHSVFESLLEEKNINDDIIEGAIVLMSQVGKTIDGKIKENLAQIKKGEMNSK